ncbi:MAG: hypothetical protein LBT49_00700 [Prevotellaceae bacterium]|jgi:hypothetical protein|nr:hypothetical protein [Prevotellaceae bacterium]
MKYKEQKLNGANVSTIFGNTSAEMLNCVIQPLFIHLYLFFIVLAGATRQHIYQSLSYPPPRAGDISVLRSPFSVLRQPFPVDSMKISRNAKKRGESGTGYVKFTTFAH